MMVQIFKISLTDRFLLFNIDVGIGASDFVHAS